MYHKTCSFVNIVCCRFAFVTELTTPPPRDTIQNVENKFASFKDGVTTVRFSRLRDTGDVNDVSLSDCIFFLYAWGGYVSNITTGEIAYHGLNRRFVSDSRVCIASSASFCFDEQCKRDNHCNFIFIYIF